MSANHEFEIELADGHRENLRRIGPGAVGVVYQSPTTWYRVFKHRLSLPMKLGFQDLLNKTQPGCATVTNFWQHPETGWHLVRYDPPAGAKALQSVQESGDVQGGLRGLAAVVRGLPGWWSSIATPLLPTPSDFLLTTRGEALLLPWAAVGLPTTEDLFEEPSRAGFLAPELFRGSIAQEPARLQALDNFAVGAALLSCFFKPLESFDAGEAISRAALGDACRWRSWRDALPFWIDQVNVTDNIIALGRQMASPQPERRNAFNFAQMSEFLMNFSRRMEPLTVFREAIRVSAHKAMELLEKLRLENETYELLIEGAQMAWKADAELKALQLYERAIERNPHRHEAYRGQFDVIAFAQNHPNLPLSVEYATKLDFARHLDQCIRRDYAQLESRAPEKVESRELKMAQHDLWRAQHYRMCAHSLGPAAGESVNHFLESAQECLAAAEEFIKNHLRDRRGHVLAWKLRLRLVGCEVELERALFHKEPIQKALDLYNAIVPDISRYAANLQLAEEVREANKHAHRLHHRLSQLAQAP